MMNHDIFISYSSKQKSIADGVCHYLEENGFKCWMAPRDIPVGSKYGDLIEMAIKTCKIVVLVFSEAASLSNWVEGEINVAFTEHKPILPFRIDETEITGGFRVMLNQMHWIDAFPHYADKLPDLLKSVSGIMGKQSGPLKVDENQNVKKSLIEDMAYVNERTSFRMPKRYFWVALGVVVIAVSVVLLAWPKNPKISVGDVYNGHNYVDLGLPSGTLWATCNVGATRPENYGDYFAWGETMTKTIYDWSTYSYYKESEDYMLTKYCNRSNSGYKGFTDNLTTLQSDDDVATVNWGGGWCIPTNEQWEELTRYTKNKRMKLNNIKGRVFTSNNGNSLFLPAAGCRFAWGLDGDGFEGYYWSSSLDMDDPILAWSFNFYSTTHHMYNDTRHDGLSVRPVRIINHNK